MIRGISVVLTLLPSPVSLSLGSSAEVSELRVKWFPGLLSSFCITVVLDTHARSASALASSSWWTSSEKMPKPSASGLAQPQQARPRKPLEHLLGNTSRSEFLGPKGSWQEAVGCWPGVKSCITVTVVVSVRNTE